MDKIAAHIAHEHVAAVRRWIGRASINRDASRRSKEAGREQLRRRQTARKHGIGRALTRTDDPPRFRRTDPKHRRGRPLGGDVEDHRRGNQGGIAFQVMRRQNDLADMIAVVAGEAMSPIVKAMAELPASRDRLKSGTVRLETKVAPTNGDRLGLGPRTVVDRPTVTAGHAIDPTVRTPEQPVEQSLDIFGPEPREHHLLDVGNPVAIDVLGIEDVRRDRDEYAPIVRNNPGRPGKPVHEDGPRFESAVAIAIYQPADVSRRCFLRKRVTPHLDDVESPIGVVTDTDRIGDQWLDGHRLQIKALVDPE